MKYSLGTHMLYIYIYAEYILFILSNLPLAGKEVYCNQSLFIIVLYAK
jgi:hypothetical protein